MRTCKGQPDVSSASQFPDLPDPGPCRLSPSATAASPRLNQPRALVYISSLPLMSRSMSTTGVSTAVMTSQEEPVQMLRRPGYGTFEEQRQRRHSWHTRPCLQEAENFQLMVGKLSCICRSYG